MSLSSSSSLPECHLMSFDKDATYFRILCLNHLSHILSRNCTAAARQLDTVDPS